MTGYGVSGCEVSPRSGKSFFIPNEGWFPLRGNLFPRPGPGREQGGERDADDSVQLLPRDAVASAHREALADGGHVQGEVSGVEICWRVALAAAPLKPFAQRRCTALTIQGNGSRRPWHHICRGPPPRASYQRLVTAAEGKP